MTDSLGKLLIVDDLESNRDLLKRRLERRGYEAKVAKDGREALARISEEKYDLVLLDIMMPGFDGMEVLESVRAEHTRLQLPIIMVTAKGETSDVVEALKSGANDYVTKPLDLEVLLARVGTHVILKRTTESLEAANQRLRQDLEAAARIQQAQLPARSPQFGPFRFSWQYRPCEQLAGDYLNIIPLSPRHVGFYLLDVSGHGVQAALLAVSVNHMLTPGRGDTSIVNRPNRDRKQETDDELLVTPPEEVAEKLNRRFQFDSLATQFFTVFYGVIDMGSGKCRYVSTGHPSPILIGRNGQQQVLESNGPPIGVISCDDSRFEPYQSYEIQLERGDRLYLFSDGLLEAMNSRDEQFGRSRLTELTATVGADPLDMAVEKMIRSVVEWQESGASHDDMSLLALEWDGATT